MSTITLRVALNLSPAQRLAMEKALCVPGELLTAAQAEAWAEREILWALERLKASERTRGPRLVEEAR